MTQRRRKEPQGPATSFVVACALVAVAGALGYKLPAQRPLLRGPGPAKAMLWRERKSGLKDLHFLATQTHKSAHPICDCVPALII